MGTLVNGIKEIFATSQTTATHLPVCASDGTPQGRISVGDLASVLGGLKWNPMPPSGFDCNTIRDTSLYGTSSDAVTAAIINAPSTYSGGNALLLTYKVQGNFAVQMFFHYATSTVSSENYIYVRLLAENGIGSWCKYVPGMPLFYKNYSTLAELMSGLNVNPVGNKVNVTNQNIDLNSLDDGFYIGNNFKNDVGAPSIAGLLTQWSWNIGEQKYAFQLFFSYDAKMFFRTYWSVSWQSWRKIECTLVTTT